ncbi:MAG: hypothetical protein AB7Q42_11755 [Acidimicrobiia bacterium]
MNEFDDPILRDRLSRYAGPSPDGDTAYVGVQQRVRHVKRRRAAIWSGAALTVIGVGTANALGGSEGAKVTVPPAAETELPSTVATTIPTTTSTSTTTTVVTTETAAPESTPAASAVENPDLGSGNGDNGGSPNTEGATPPPAAAPAGADEDARSAAGGTLHVRLADGSLSLVSATPNDGFTVHVADESGSRIRVWFERRRQSSTITATVVDGRISFRVRERGGDGDDATRTTVDDDHDRDDRDGDGRDDDRRDGDGRDGDDGADRDHSRDGDSGADRDHPDD